MNTTICRTCVQRCRAVHPYVSPRVGSQWPLSCRKVTTKLESRRGYANVITKRDGDTREKIVILGSGWAGFVLAHTLDPKKYNVLIVSPRSYFVFTPLLNDTAVGTLEFRTALESVRSRRFKGSFLQGWADDVNFADKIVNVEPSVLDPNLGHAMTGSRWHTCQSEIHHHTFKEEEILNKMVDEGKLMLGGIEEDRVPTYPVTYDKLVIAVGSYSQTFGTPGVKENALFLKDVNDARRIRRRVLELFELASLPMIPEEIRKCLLHIAVVGGGPTGMEFAASVTDLIHQDLAKLYPKLIKYVQITLYDVAPKVLPMFEAELADYAVKQYARQNIRIKTTHHVEELRKGFPGEDLAREYQDEQTKGRIYTIRTKEEGDVGIGMCVWSTGNMSNPFVQKALTDVRRWPEGSAEVTSGEVEDPTNKTWTIQRDPRSGAMIVDDHFRVQLQTTTTDGTSEDSSPDPANDSIQAEAIMQDVFAIGDNCKLLSGALPATAQVANQEAKFLAKIFNKSHTPGAYAKLPGFSFKDMGVMTYLGGSTAVLQGPNVRHDGTKKKGFSLKGWLAYWTWRGAYLSMTLSWRNRFLIPVHWLVVKMFGRDISRF